MGCYGHGKEPSGSIKDRELLDEPSDRWLLKNISVAWSQ
jgi:hypothetical protein